MGRTYGIIILDRWEVSNLANTKRRCPALIAAGIEDPDSEEGALFCAGSRHGQIASQCPYPCCVVYETQASNVIRRIARIEFAKKFSGFGISIKDIALILGVTKVTVKGYLKQ